MNWFYSWNGISGISIIVAQRARRQSWCIDDFPVFVADHSASVFDRPKVRIVTVYCVTISKSDAPDRSWSLWINSRDGGGFPIAAYHQITGSQIINLSPAVWCGDG